MVGRLAEFRIDKLFGLYSHNIKLNLDERITIIIGPNGRGKTVCLKFIEALFLKKYSYFAEIPFDSASFIFVGGEILTISTPDISDVSSADFSNSNRVSYFTLSSPGQEEVKWSPTLINKSSIRELSRHIPGSWRQLTYDTWVDDSDGEETTTDDLITRYRVPSKIASSIRPELPEQLIRLVEGIDCHLIETQRLLVLSSEERSDRDLRFYQRAMGRSRESRLAIQLKAEKLKTILGQTITRYATLSQSLERTFPLRVFEAQGSAKLSEDDLRAELKKLDKRRDALMVSGIVDTDYQPVSLRPGNIDPGVVMALEIYVRDTTSKLDVFNDILARVDLFKELIGSRFIDKKLSIDRESGFNIISSNGSIVPLEKLSSGEQHQLILIFDLLFEVSANSLILIDEPELSLHVAWQKTFIESLSKIIALNAFDVLLATHSPAIVARHFDLAVELAPVDL